MIRIMQEPDIEKVMALWLDTNRTAHSFIPEEYWLSHFSAVRETIPQAEVYVYESSQNSDIEGFIGVTDNFIAGIFVRAQSQSSGIGTQLLNFVKAKKKKLSLLVYQKNQRALQFYLREHFFIQKASIDNQTDEKELLMEWKPEYEPSFKKGAIMKKILIVVDMQNDFVDGALGTKEAAGIVDSVAAKIEGFDGEIIATLDTHAHNYLETAEGKKLPVPHCIRMTNGWLLNEKVLTALSSKKYQLIEKNTFGSTRLVEEIRRLKEGHEIELEFIGLCTDICVISNVLLLKAYFPETTIRVDASCCAGVTPETHQAALDTMKMCQIEII